MDLGHELIAGQGMADQDRVGLVRVERAIGLIGQGEGAEAGTGIQGERPVRREAERVAWKLGRLDIGYRR
jgi:hypothetical protein